MKIQFSDSLHMGIVAVLDRCDICNIETAVNFSSRFKQQIKTHLFVYEKVKSNHTCNDFNHCAGSNQQQTP